MNRHIFAAQSLLRAAKAVLADYEYVNDPRHQKRPEGGGWKMTSKGWSRGTETDAPKATKQEADSLREKAKSGDWEVRYSVSKDKKTPVETLEQLAEDRDGLIRYGVANNPSAPTPLLKKMTRDDDMRVRVAAEENLKNKAIKERTLDRQKPSLKNVMDEIEGERKRLEKSGFEKPNFELDGFVSFDSRETPIRCGYYPRTDSPSDETEEGFFVVDLRTEDEGSRFDTFKEAADYAIELNEKILKEKKELKEKPAEEEKKEEKVPRPSSEDADFGIVGEATEEEALSDMSKSKTAFEREMAAGNPKTSAEDLERLCGDSDKNVAESAARTLDKTQKFDKKSSEVLAGLGARLEEADGKNRYRIDIDDTYDYDDGETSGTATFEVYLNVYRDGGKIKMEMKDYNNGSWSEYEPDIEGVEFTPTSDEDTAKRIDQFVKDAKKSLRSLCAEIENKNRPAEKEPEAEDDPYERYRAAKGVTDAEKLAQLADDENDSIRMEVARNRLTSPSTLSKLAGDEEAFVRGEVASNMRTPAKALESLTHDRSRGVAGEAQSTLNTQTELKKFKGTLGPRGQGRSEGQLKQDFIMRMKREPNESMEAFQNRKERIQAMSPQQFGAMLAAIMDDDEEIVVA